MGMLLKGRLGRQISPPIYKYQKAVGYIIYLPILLLASVAVFSSYKAYGLGVVSKEILVITSSVWLLILSISALIFSRYFRAGMLILIAILTCSGIFTLWSWGLIHPIGFLLILLMLNLSFITLTSNQAKAIAIIIFISVLGIGLLQKANLITHSVDWIPRLTSMDLIIIGILLGLIVLTTLIQVIGSNNQLVQINKMTIQLKRINQKLNKEVIKKTKQVISSKTELSKSYKTLNQAYEQLEDAEVDRFTKMNTLAHYGTIMTSVVHNMANPVMLIMSYLQEAKFRNKKIVMESVDELATTIRSVRGYIKVSEESEVINVVECLEDSLNTLDWKIEKYEITILRKYSDGMDCMVKGPSDKLHQILLNLIDNAVDANIERRRKRVYIRMWCDQKNIHIEIKDSGGGIPKRNQKKIFEIFYSTKKHGSGIGLFISRKYIEQLYKGKIIVKESNESGSTFYITLQKWISEKELY